MTKTVNEITQLNITGNIIPMVWLESIKFPSGKPDLLGIMLLAEIVYWYRAKEVRDEVTGRVVGYKKKFKADKLQKNYQQFADQFGASKRQIQDAIYRLRDSGLITVELRIVKTSEGLVMSNVPYFEPVPERIKEITYPPHLHNEKINDEISDIDPVESCDSATEGGHVIESDTSCNELREGHVTEREGSCNRLHEGIHSNVGGHVIDYMTYTKTTTKTTTSSLSEAEEKNDSKIEKLYLDIIGENIPPQLLPVLSKYPIDEIEFVFNILQAKRSQGKIKNPSGLLLKDTEGIIARIKEGNFYPDKNELDNEIKEFSQYTGLNFKGKFQKDFYKNWRKKISKELMFKAGELTIKYSGNLEYLDKILNDWEGKGIVKPEQVKPKKKTQKSNNDYEIYTLP